MDDLFNKKVGIKVQSFNSLWIWEDTPCQPRFGKTESFGFNGVDRRDYDLMMNDCTDCRDLSDLAIFLASEREQA